MDYLDMTQKIGRASKGSREEKTVQANVKRWMNGNFSVLYNSSPSPLPWVKRLENKIRENPKERGKKIKSSVPRTVPQFMQHATVATIGTIKTCPSKAQTRAGIDTTRVFYAAALPRLSFACQSICFISQVNK
jgi:hypothetical protein